MSTIVSCSIDLNKIDKSRIVEGKNGAKYYNMTVIINDTKDQYGNDVGVQQGQTKEERAAKAKAVFIGNGKTIWKSDGSVNTVKSEPKGNDFGDLPF